MIGCGRVPQPTTTERSESESESGRRVGTELEREREKGQSTKMMILAGSSTSAAALLVVAAVLVAAGSAQQAPSTSCVSKLAVCAPYLNSTSPPDTCCGSMKEALKDELPCLCNLFNSPAVLKAFNIDVNQVLRLPKSCGIHADTKICSNSSATATTPPSTTSAPATPRSRTPNTAYGAKQIGALGLASCILLWWSIVA